MDNFQITYENHITWNRYEEKLKYKLESQIEYELVRVIEKIALIERSYITPNKWHYLILQCRHDLFQCKLHEIEVPWRDSLIAKQLLALRKYLKSTRLNEKRLLLPQHHSTFFFPKLIQFYIRSLIPRERKMFQRLHHMFLSQRSSLCQGRTNF